MVEDKQSLHCTILCAVSMEGPDNLQAAKKIISEISVLQDVGNIFARNGKKTP